MIPIRYSVLILAAGLTIAALAGCSEKRRSAGSKGNAPASSAHVFGLSAGEDVPPSCRAYAEKMIQCMQDPHFPKDARDAQTSALVQMMDRMKLTGIAAAERAEATRNAADECDTTLSALRAASGTSCPSAF
jgi:hypothetical protein